MIAPTREVGGTLARTGLGGSPASSEALRWLWPGATLQAMTAGGGRALTLGGAAPVGAGAFGDARQVDGAATNLVTNPSFETGTAGWVQFNGATIAQNAADARFGANSLLVTTPGSVGDEGARQITKISVAPSTVYTYSMWFKRTSGNVHINANAFDSGSAYLTTFAGPSTLLTGAWQRIRLTFTTTALTTQVDLYAMTSGAQALSFRVDGAQLEQRAYASSALDGSLGSGYAWTGAAHASTSTRAASRVQAAGAQGAVLDARRGAVVAWLRPAWGTAAAPATPRVFRVAASANEALDLRFDDATAHWTFDSTHGGVTDSVTSAVDSFAGDTPKVVVAGWGEARVSVSVDGGTAVTAARAAGIPALGSALIDLGSTDGTSGHLDGVIGPVVAFDRRLTQHQLTIAGRLARPLGWRELGDIGGE